eukprot:gene3786-4309_t
MWKSLVILVLQLASLVLSSNKTLIVNENEREIALVVRLIGSPQYDFRIRPNFPTGPTVIKIDFTVLSIEDLQIEDMGFSMEIFLMQQWYDKRLRHNYHPHLDGSNFVDRIWMPDTYFKESKIVKKRQMEKKKLLLRIYPDGLVYYSTKVSLRLSCSMNLEKFPMDVQQCLITMESYGYDGGDVIYKWKDNKSMHEFNPSTLSLSHYELTPMIRQERTLSYLYGKWSSLEVKLMFKRISSAFIPAMYFPCTVIVLVSWITFFIHPNHFPARTNLCAISVLTMLTLQGAINNTLPKVSYLKVIDTYVMGCVLFVSFAFVEYAIVLLLKHKKKRTMSKREKKKIEKLIATGATELHKVADENNDIIRRVYWVTSMKNSA